MDTEEDWGYTRVGAGIMGRGQTQGLVEEGLGSRLLCLREEAWGPESLHLKEEAQGTEPLSLSDKGLGIWTHGSEEAGVVEGSVLPDLREEA